MEKYFPGNKIVVTGNPVRNLTLSDELRKEAMTYFNLDSDKPVVFAVGGSLGARTINEALLKGIETINNSGIQLIWQTGKIYYKTVKEEADRKAGKNIHVYDFISRMDLAYNVADLMISRAGAISISEICLTGKAAILVPSPNVAEDHQTKNAQALVKEEAAVMITDVEAPQALVNRAIEIIKDKKLLEKLSVNSRNMAKPSATAQIVDEVYKLLGKDIS
jgi:UDP-N-acetylglucosamine--N-acetylmuramyl-(pentapeptide) pyrophosphoryl-undecaprenol N-acetylglucosamine transferase